MTRRTAACGRRYPTPRGIVSCALPRGHEGRCLDEKGIENAEAAARALDRAIVADATVHDGRHVDDGCPQCEQYLLVSMGLRHGSTDPWRYEQEGML